MASVPYPVDGTVYDRDGSTALENATVTALNITTGERTSMVTNASGQFIIDLANFASGYTNGDKVQVTAQYGGGETLRSLSKRHTINTGEGSYSIGNMILHQGEEPFGTCYITFASHTNSTGGGLYVDFYDRTNNQFQFRIESAAGETNSMPMGFVGTKMAGGFIRVFESETAGSSEVLILRK